MLLPLLARIAAGTFNAHAADNHLLTGITLWFWTFQQQAFARPQPPFLENLLNSLLHLFHCSGASNGIPLPSASANLASVTCLRFNRPHGKRKSDTIIPCPLPFGLRKVSDSFTHACFLPSLAEKMLSSWVIKMVGLRCEPPT